MHDRKLAKQSPIRASHLAYSDRYQQATALESTIELDYFNWLNFERTASEVRAQPYSIRYLVGKEYRRYTPDFLVVKSGQEYLDEVKAYTATLNEAFIDKVHCLTDYFAQRGQVFRVITDRDIRRGERAKNLRYLQPALHHPAPYQEMQRLKALDISCPVLLYELQISLDQYGFDQTLIRRAIAHKLMTSDLTQPWHALKLIW